MATATRMTKKQRERSNRFSTTTTLHVHHAFLYISQPSLHDCDMKLRHLRAPALWGGTKHKNYVFLFVNLDTVLSDSTPEISPIFDKLNEVE